MTYNIKRKEKLIRTLINIIRHGEWGHSVQAKRPDSLTLRTKSGEEWIFSGGITVFTQAT